MLLLIHISLAFASLVCSGFALISPSKNKLRAAYELVSLTLVSGTYLVLHNHVPLTQSCLSGLAYLVVVGTGLAVSRHRLSLKVR